MKTPYRPQPVDTSRIELPEELHEVRELLAKNTHDAWAAQRFSQGWTWGDTRDDRLKRHPCLVPYEELPEEEKEYDRIISAQTLKLILALGFEIRKREE